MAPYPKYFGTGDTLESDGTAGSIVDNTSSTHKKMREMIPIDFRRVLSKKRRGKIQQRKKKRK